MPPPGPASLAQALAGVARRLAGERDLEATVQAIVLAAVDSIPGADLGGISVLEGRDRIVVRQESDPLVTEIDQVQNDLHQGPCLEVLTAAERVVSDDLTTDRRWPEFRERIAGRGVRSALSLRLHLEHTTGTLSVFARSVGAFTAESEVIGELFATHAAVALAGVQREQHLALAVRRRDVIGMAKGLVMAWHQVSEQDAFTALVRLSSTENTKLYDVAARLVEQSQPPPRPAAA